MIIRLAEIDELSKWKIVAHDVVEIFGNLNMANDSEFIDYAQRKILQKEAFIAVDDFNKEYFGFIGISRHFNRITWFGILEKSRNKGIGSKLLEKAINELDNSKEITVETYRENYIPGKPARHIYAKYSFKEIENNLFDSFGNERCKLAILPQSNLK
jgi:ribosomal protein S18 acetylase RimI-like enzyme